MALDNFLQTRAQAGTALFVLGGIAAQLREAGNLPEEIAQLTHELRTPIRIAVLGAERSGKSTLLNTLFETDFVPPAPAGGHGIVVYRHRNHATQGAPPLGVNEKALSHEFLLDFTVIDTPGLKAGDKDLVAHLEELCVETDLLLCAVSALDPWNTEIWSFLQNNRKRFGPGAILLLLQCDVLPGDEREGVVRYFQQTAQRKLGSAFEAVLDVSSHQAMDALGNGDAVAGEKSNFARLHRALEQMLSHHPRLIQIGSYAARGAELSREAVAFARRGLEDLRHDEREVFDLERSLLTQYGWLRRELQDRLAAVSKSSAREFVEAGQRFAECISLSRLDLVATDRKALALQLQEDVADSLRSSLVPQMDDAAARFETHLEESWKSLFSRLQPRFVGELKNSHAAFPHLREAHEALASRLEVDLRDILAGEDVRNQVGGMLAQAAAMNFQPFAIVLASILAGALAAFQGGCELAGGMIFGVGVLATGWSLFAGMSLRKLLRFQYRQLCEHKLQQVLVRLREDLERFAEGILEEMGRKLRGMNDLSYSARTAQEPLVEKALRVAESLDGLAARLNGQGGQEATAA